MRVDRDAPLRFLTAAFLPDDWIAVLLKRHDSGEAIQRVGPVGMVLDARFQSWLRFKNAQRFNVFVSINALTPGRRSRTRDSVTAVRHVFLDADNAAGLVLRAIKRRSDLPAPSFVLHSSEGRAHVLWRVQDVSVDRAEELQKHLARELGTDTAATSVAQLTRLPGFFNHKYTPPFAVAVTLNMNVETWSAEDISEIQTRRARRPALKTDEPPPRCAMPMLERARRYLAATPPAIQGNHGDLKTFIVCCRLVGRFGLSDRESLHVLSSWNARCQPPWSEPTLLRKVRSARRSLYGRTLE